jgi:hypothetical protein
MTLDIAADRYNLTGTGRATGLMRAMGGGSGEVSVRGLIAGKKVSSTNYAHAIESSKKHQAIKMQLAAGLVKQLSVLPPVEPTANVVAITDAHKRGVVDPLSAGIIPAAGPHGVGPEACAQKLPIFDGRLRFDLTLAYKRQETVRAEGYEGPAVVCSVTFEPLGGHNKERFAIRFLRENRDMEIWFAPVAGTPFLVFFRIFVPTLLGPGVMQATRFVATGTTRAGALVPQLQ